MDDKKAYTPEELKEALEEYGKYREQKKQYSFVDIGVNFGRCMPINKVNRLREILKEQIKKCKDKIPKSLIGILEIEDIE